MNYQTAVVIASLTHQTNKNIHDLDSHDLMNKLLSMEYQNVILNGALIDKFSNGVFLFVDEDIKLLIDEYLYLVKLIKAQNHYQHGTYLNDGRLSMTATSDRKLVEIEFRYCPDLKATSLVTHTVTISEDEHICWWRSIVYGILDLIRQKPDES